MAKKRKSNATRLDEVDRGMYTAFCGAANSLSQLYSQAVNQQRLSFQAGERHAMEKLYSWISRQQEDGIRVMTDDILAYLQWVDRSVQKLISLEPLDTKLFAVNNQIIELFQKCHTDHPLGKFFGECTDLEIKLDKVFRQEVSLRRSYEMKRKANFEESQKYIEGLREYRLGASKTPEEKSLA